MQRHGEPLHDRMRDAVLAGRHPPGQRHERGAERPASKQRPGAARRGAAAGAAAAQAEVLGGDHRRRRAARRVRHHADPGVGDPRRDRHVPDGCITPDEAYEEIDWMVLVLLGAIIPLGLAMQNTGTAELLAARWWCVRREPLGLYGVLATFYLLTSVLTELISNNAAAVVLTPIAIATRSRSAHRRCRSSLP
jgi:hypothetical protein